MKILLFNIFILIFINGLYAQEDSTVNRISYRLNLSEFANSIFMYPQFLEGEIILKDGPSVNAKLNYNRVLGQMLFIGRGKTLAFARPEALKEIIIEKDTFKFYNNGYLKKLTHFSGVNLYTKQTLLYYVKSKTGIDGMPLINYDNPKLPYSSDNLGKNDNELNENSIFRFVNEYFFEDKSAGFLPATKKSLYDLFSSHKEYLNSYLQHREVNFDNTVQLSGLLEYMDNL